MASAGTFQLFCQISRGVPLSVNGASSTNGAGLSIYNAPTDNADRFVLEQVSADHWTVRNVNSGLYLTVLPADDYAGASVVQWPDQGANSQWRLETVGSATMGGVTCEVLELFTWADGAADTYCLNSGVYADNGQWGNGTESCHVSTVYSDSWRRMACRWIAYGTYPIDPNLPVPNNVSWAKAPGSDDFADVQVAAPLLYPTWVNPDSWGEATDAGWQYCYQTRTMGITSSTWGEWSNVTAWQDAQLTTKDGTTRVWLTGGIPATYDVATAKALQVRFLLRCKVTDANGVQWVGPESSQVLQSGKAPTVTLSNAGFGPSGLYFDATSDYTAGRTFVAITAIMHEGANILKTGGATLRMMNLDDADVFRIDPLFLNGWIDEGDEIEVHYQTGIDTQTRHSTSDPDSATVATLTVSYETGSGMAVSPAVSIGEGRLMVLDLSGLANPRAFVRANGRMYECIPTGNSTVTVEYPFNADFEVFVSAQNMDEDQWGVWHETFTPQSQLLKAHPACHAWNWDGGSFLLEVTDGIMVTERQVKANSTAVALDNRKFETVLFSPGNSATYSAEGILKRGLTESDKDGLEAMAAARHVRYRAPHGDVADVAIDGYSYEDHRTFTKVSVDMTQETV